MEDFWKAAAAVLVAVILCLSIGRQERELATLLVITVVCMTGILALRYLEPVLDLLRRLERIGDLQEGVLDSLMRILGISLAAELVGRICQDAGFGAMGKSVHFLASAAVCYGAIPLMESLIALLQEILSGL